MSHWIIYSIGFFAQILFSSRLIIQWIYSEKSKQVVTPALFWILSLLASILLFTYGALRLDFAIMLGQLLTYYIYIRNLQLQKKWLFIPLIIRFLILFIPFFVFLFYFNNNQIDSDLVFRNKAIPIWLLILGISSQLIFTFRFIYQWLYSEKRKKSSLPFGFWILSLLGALLILTYAVIRKDPVLVVGHTFGAIIYIRNLSILKNETI